jgi:hypothetical protein
MLEPGYTDPVVGYDRTPCCHDRSVPRISAFYGIVISMYWQDLHQHELKAAWEKAKSNQVPATIEPLP